MTARPGWRRASSRDASRVAPSCLLTLLACCLAVQLTITPLAHAQSTAGPPAAAPPSPSASAPPAEAAPRPGRAEALRQRRAGKGNLLGHGGPIKAIASDLASGRILTGSFDYSLMAWDVTREDPTAVARLEDHGGAVNAVAFIPGSTRVLAAADDGKIAVWDLATRTLVHRFEGHEAKVVGLSLSPDGRWAVSASWERTGRLWDLKDLKPGPVLTEHKGPVNAAVFSADGQSIFTASADGTIGAWSSKGEFLRPLYQNGWGVNVLARLPDGNLLYGALNGASGIVDAASGALIKELPAVERPILSVAVTAKPGLAAIGSGDGRIRVFRLPDAAEVEDYRNLFGPIWAMAFVADGTGLYYGGLDDFATLWRIAPREAFEPLANAGPRRFQVRPEGNDILAAGELQFARKCSICHTLEKDGGNRAGPTLWGVFGRRIGTLPGYPYSDALRSMDIVWNEETVDRLFAEGPDTYTPGSKMPLQRMTDASQRAALIAYLKAATDPATAEKR